MRVRRFFSRLYVEVSPFFEKVRGRFKRRFSHKIEKFEYGDMIQKIEVICYAVAFPFLCAWWFVYYTVRWMVFSAVFFLVLGTVFFPSITTEVFSDASAAQAKDWLFLINQWFAFNFMAVFISAAFRWIDITPDPAPGASQIPLGRIEKL